MLLCQNRPARFVCLPCSFLPTTNVCQTLASSVLFQLLWQPADAIVWHREVKRKRRENGEYKRPDNLFTDWVSIDLREAVIRATISGLMASLKVYSMNWESSIPWPQQNTISLPCQCSVHEIWPNIVISPLRFLASDFIIAVELTLKSHFQMLLKSTKRTALFYLSCAIVPHPFLSTLFTWKKTAPFSYPPHSLI